MKQGITVMDLNWGAIYEGKKADLIAAGLAEPANFPKKRGADGEKYDIEGADGVRRSARVVGDYADPKTFMIYVDFDPRRDLDFQTRTAWAERRLAALHAEMLTLMSSIAPRPLSVSMGVEAKLVTH